MLNTQTPAKAADSAKGLGKSADASLVQMLQRYDILEEVCCRQMHVPSAYACLVPSLQS